MIQVMLGIMAGAWAIGFYEPSSLAKAFLVFIAALEVLNALVSSGRR